MSACHCNERKRPICVPEGSNQRPREWVVTRRNCSYSAFNGYRYQYSKKSSIFCRVCGAFWHSQAQSIVNQLPDADPNKHPERVEPIGNKAQ